MRDDFQLELEKLNAALLSMAQGIEKAIGLSVEALMNNNVALAKEVMEDDAEINRLEKAIERQCLNLLLHQQPVASDFRLISAAIKMITDMERIGDHAADISELTIVLADTKYSQYMEKIPTIAEATIKMVNDSITAFIDKDMALAEAVYRYDDVVDDLFAEIKKDLVEEIRKCADISVQAVDLIMVAKYFEKIGDHAVNIAKWVMFALTGDSDKVKKNPHSER